MANQKIIQCTRESCPTMSGGAKFEYLWQDGTKYKKPTHLPAPQYISLLMDWVESQINDENVGENIFCVNLINRDFIAAVSGHN